jgi:hypothetical protein
MSLVGIDYSITSPALTKLSDDLTFQSSRHYYLTNTNKVARPFGNIIGSLHKPYKSDIERYENIAKWALNLIDPTDIVFIEDYALGAKGKVFNIAENTGILKYLLHLKQIRYITVPPTVIKKFFNGKGNANKEKMYETFLLKTEVDLMKLFAIKGKLTNPLTDIVDSYAIGLYGYDQVSGSKS